MIKNNENRIHAHFESNRAILTGLAKEDVSYYIEELAGLAKAAGVRVVGDIFQSKDRPDPATFIGSGKVEELAIMCTAMDADMVIFNNELTGAQIRNLEDRLGIRVLDRTILILDIFASRAISREGKLQVELAQLEYRLPRLVGFGKSLSKLAGGIGTRGPGEKMLEADRRHIRRRMDDIKREIEAIKNNRDVQRTRRESSGIPMIALVGYTNSGKSALMNRLLADNPKEGKTVTEKDMLFSTLDTSHRLIKLDSKHEFILIDTVGFVSNLPHSLVKAFKATLEEVTYADLLLHVTDASYSHSDFHMEVTDRVLEEIGAGDKDKITVYNKIDLIKKADRASFEGKNNVCISAKYGENVDLLLEMIKDRLYSDRARASLLIPYERGDVMSYLFSKYQMKRNIFRYDGIYVETEISADDIGRLKEYRIPCINTGQY